MESMQKLLSGATENNGFVIDGGAALRCALRLSCVLSHPWHFFFLCRCGPTWAMASSFTRLLDHTQRRITVGRTSLYEWTFRRRDLYLTTHNTHNRQTSMPPVGFEPTISAAERPQTYALDSAATRTSPSLTLSKQNPTQGRCYEAVTKFHSHTRTFVPNIFPFISRFPDRVVFIYF